MKGRKCVVSQWLKLICEVNTWQKWNIKFWESHITLTSVKKQHINCVDLFIFIYKLLIRLILRPLNVTLQLYNMSNRTINYSFSFNNMFIATHTFLQHCSALNVFVCSFSFGVLQNYTSDILYIQIQINYNPIRSFCSVNYFAMSFKCVHLHLSDSTWRQQQELICWAGKLIRSQVKTFQYC